jgi:hypothetical protein
MDQLEPAATGFNSKTRLSIRNKRTLDAIKVRAGIGTISTVARRWGEGWNAVIRPGSRLIDADTARIASLTGPRGSMSVGGSTTGIQARLRSSC